MQSIEFRAMGGRVSALIDDDGPQAAAALSRMPGWFEDRERCLSRFREGSELRRLNAAGTAQVAPELWEAIGIALRAAERTGGLVTPTVLPALEGRGYDRSFEEVPGAIDQPVRATAGAADPRVVERVEEQRTVRLPPNVRLDLGGTAKGWCADRAARLLASIAPALVDAGGDVAVCGRAPAGGWPVAVAAPTEPDDRAKPTALARDGMLELVGLRAGGVATSGRDHRRWRRGGAWQHHLIDPRTGAPAQTDVWTATVIGPSALEAEVAAKVVVLLGSDEGLRWIEDRPALAALVVRDDGQVLRSSTFASHVWTDDRVPSVLEG